MARLLVTTFCFALFASIIYSGFAKGASPKCGEREVLVDCPVDCPVDFCPKNSHHDQLLCLPPEKCPPPACKCEFNHRRAANGTCIRTTDCPPFPCDGPHESFNPCPSYCPGDDCIGATADGMCHAPGVLPVIICSPACTCDKTYWRLNGICVPYEKCIFRPNSISV